MENQIKIQQMDLSAKDNVLTFLKTAYADNPRQSDATFWDWHFVQSPMATDGLPVWLAMSGGRIAGQLAAIPVELNVAGRTERAIWILDLIVDPDFRRRGIAQKLVLAAKEFCPWLLGVNTNEQHAPAMLQKQGFVIVTKIPRFHKILFPGEALREITGIAPLRATANALFAPFRRGTRDARGNVRRLESFDNSFDELWQKARTQWQCSISRTSAMLEWQFRRQPEKQFEVLGYYEDRELRGYAVLFFRKPNKNGAVDKAAISDIVYHPDNSKHVIDSLLCAALDLAIERRAGGLVTDALDPLLQECLGRRGFWPINSGLQLMVNAPEDTELLYNRENWFLTRSDADISIFEAPNS